MVPDRDLIGTWLTGWAHARGVGVPLDLGDCWQVEIGWPSQTRRYVFPQPSPGLAKRAAAITDPLVYLKCFIPVEDMAALLPPRWVIEPQCFMMVLDALAPPPLACPDGYRLQQDGRMARVLFGDSLVASGHVMKEQGLAVFVGIKVNPAYQRRGLGHLVMAALTVMARNMGASRGALVATAQGAALYRKLGWCDYALYASAHPDIQR